MTEPNKSEARKRLPALRASDTHTFRKHTVARSTVDIHREMKNQEEKILRALGITPGVKGHQKCPFPDHEDKHPSWRWDRHQARWFCSCGHGTVVDAAMRMLGLSGRDAIGWIRGHLVGKAEAPRQATVLKFQSRREETAWERYCQNRALEIWRNGVAIAGTPAEVYLRSRGLDPHKMRHDPPGWPETMRWCEDASTRRGGGEGALIAAINEHGSGLVVAVQRIFLRADGSPVLDPAGKKVKKALGGFRGHAAGLSAWPDPEGRWGIAEGIETALAAQQLYGFPVCAAISAGNMANIKPPHWAQSAIVCADYDEGGEKAARRSFEALKNVPALGKVEIVRATQLGCDMADVLVRRTCHG